MTLNSVLKHRLASLKATGVSVTIEDWGLPLILIAYPEGNGVQAEVALQGDEAKEVLDDLEKLEELYPEEDSQDLLLLAVADIVEMYL